MEVLLAQLESSANELAAAVKVLADCCRSGQFSTISHVVAVQSIVLPAEAPSEAQRARDAVLENAEKIQTLLTAPTDFIQHLASKTQLLGCLRLLEDFQVLPCIQMGGTVSIQDVAHLAAVPEILLSRVIRMTATAGFLHEPEPGQVGHTTLSSMFVNQPSLRDASLFLAECAAPACLAMAPATRRYGLSDRPLESAYSVASSSSQTFQQAREQRPRLDRQWAAYQQYVGEVGSANSEDDELLRRLDWLNLGAAYLVEVGAQSVHFALALADLYPALRFVLQTGRERLEGQIQLGSGNGNRITVQTRALGAPQTVRDAAVYIIRLSSLSSRPTIIAELRAHLSVLSGNSRATLILTTPRLLPEPGSVNMHLETVARLRDLSLIQLANERDLEVAELIEMITSVSDSVGRLIVANKLRLRTNVTVALAIKYQPHIHPTHNL